MKQYNIKIADYDGNVIEEQPISEMTLIIDYLSLDKSTIILPYVSSAKIGYRVEIYDNKYSIAYVNHTVYSGFISDLIEGKNETTIYLKPLWALLDIDVYDDLSTLSSGMEAWILNIFKRYYQSNADAKMNFGLVSTYTTDTTLDANLGIESNIFNLYDVALTMFLKYDVFLTIGWFGDMDSIFNYALKSGDSGNYIETNAPYVLNYSFDFPNNVLNKITYINTYDETTRLTYYLKTDETVDTDSTTDRIEPVVFSTVFYTPTTDFATETLALAKTALSLSNYNFLIEITIFNTSISLNFYQGLRSKFKIIHNGTTYNVPLTAYEILTEGTTKLTFGSIRTDLTQLLQLEGRDNI